MQQLVQHGVVAESALARDARFYAQLLPASRFEEQIAKRALKEMVGSSAYIFRPAERLSEIRRKLRKRFQGVRNDRSLCSTNLPPSLVSVRRLEVTPTKVYCLGPETGLANRVIRKLRGADRLMRVTFRDEGGGQLSSRALQSEESEDKRSDLYHRIEAFLRDGFAVGSRRYVFLAFSTSQVREQAVWFYAPEGEESADRVRAKLGDFAGINNVGKSVQ